MDEPGATAWFVIQFSFAVDKVFRRGRAGRAPLLSAWARPSCRLPACVLFSAAQIETIDVVAGKPLATAQESDLLN